MFNKPVVNSDQNGQEIGKMDEIFGPSTKYFFSVTPVEGFKLKGFKEGDKIYIDKAFLLPLHIIESAENPKPKIKKMSGGSRPSFRGSGGFQRGGF